MSDDSPPPDFPDFTRWLAAKTAASGASNVQPSTYAKLLVAARAARDETIRATPTSPHRLEILQLLAAATNEDNVRPPELTTARGFRVTLAYDEGETADKSSIAVLVQCPAEMLPYVQGETAYLWNGSERFALGQFDADGKAIGTLPAGVEISLTDFTLGKVKLEEPSSPTD